jgi:hypothetical protein
MDNLCHQEAWNWGGIFKRTDDHIFEKTLKIELSPIPQAYYLKAIERNGNNISADVTDDVIANDYNDPCFSHFQTIWQLSWTSWYCIINTIYIHINLQSLRNRLEKLAKGSFFYLFLIKARINKFYIFRQCRYIVYLLNDVLVCFISIVWRPLATFTSIWII